MSSGYIPENILTALLILPKEDQDSIKTFLQECIYYGSPVNKYINLYHPTKFTLMNADMIFHCRSTGILFLAESKRHKEYLKDSQFTALLELAKIGGYGFVYVIRGDFPNDENERDNLLLNNGGDIEITKVNPNGVSKTKQFTLKQFDDWLKSKYIKDKT
jgi:hypothetical protein